MGSAMVQLREHVHEAKSARGEPESWDAGLLLKQAVRESIAVPGFRGVGESPGDRMKRLKAAIEGKLVAFHEALPVVPYTDPTPAAIADGRLWRVGIPLTLFPKRDSGFTGVEYILEFHRGDRDDGLRVLAVHPEKRTKVLGRIEMRASAGLNADGGATLPGGPRLPGIKADAVASASVHAKVEAGPFVYEASRTCVDTEIVRGTGAVWRLDDPNERQRIGRESHELGVILEVTPGPEPIHAAGYLKAYTSTDLLTVSLGGAFWKAFKGALKTFFQGGCPHRSLSRVGAHAPVVKATWRLRSIGTRPYTAMP